MEDLWWSTQTSHLKGLTTLKALLKLRGSHSSKTVQVIIYGWCSATLIIWIIKWNLISWFSLFAHLCTYYHVNKDNLIQKNKTIFWSFFLLRSDSCLFLVLIQCYFQTMQAMKYYRIYRAISQPYLLIKTALYSYQVMIGRHIILITHN